MIKKRYSLETVLREFINMPSTLIRYGMVRSNPEIVSRKSLDQLNRRREEAWRDKRYQDVQDLWNPIELIDVSLLAGVHKAFFGWEKPNQEILNTTIQGEILDSMKRLPQGSDKEHSSDKIKSLIEILSAVNSERHSLLWIDLTVTLARLMIMTGENRDTHLMTARENCKKALKWLTCHSFPRQRLELHLFLGMTNPFKTTGNIKNVFEEIRQYCEWTDTDPLLETFRSLKVQNLTNHGLYQMLKTEGNRIENYRASVNYFYKALSLTNRHESPVNWAMLHQNLTGLHVSLFHMGGWESHSKAIEHGENALEILSKTFCPVTWAGTLANLSGAYILSPVGNRADNIDRGIDYIKKAMEVISPSSNFNGWLNASLNIANGYWNRIKGDRSQNLEIGISYLTEALQATDPSTNPIVWIKLLANLSGLHVSLISGDPAENMEIAINYLHEALALCNKQTFPFERTIILENLGIVYYKRLRGDFADNIEKSIEYLNESLTFLDKEKTPSEWARAKLNLGNAYGYRRKGDKDQNLELAVQCLQDTLTVRSKESNPVSWANTMYNLGYVYQCSEAGDKQENLEKALRCYMEAVSVDVSDLLAHEWFKFLGNTLNVVLMLKKWEEFPWVIEKIKTLDQWIRYQEVTQNTTVFRIENTGEIFYKIAFGYFQSGQQTHAIEWLEKSRTQMLRERMAHDRALFLQLKPRDRDLYLQVEERLRCLVSEQSGSTPLKRTLLDIARDAKQVREELRTLVENIRTYQPEFLSEGLSYVDIPACLPDHGGTALIAYNITEFGSHVCLISGTPGEPVVKSMSLDQFNDESLKRIIEQWGEAARQLTVDETDSEKQRVWSDTVLSIMEEVYSDLFEPLVAEMDAIKPDTVIFMPHKSMHILPLHLMNRVSNGTRKYLLDEYEIHFIPSFELLHRNRTNMNIDLQSLTAVSDPTNELKWAREEVDFISGYFRDKRILAGTEATLTALLKAAPASHVLHFSCHGEFDMVNPYDSGLIMALSDSSFSGSYVEKAALAKSVYRSESGLRVYEVRSLGDDETETLAYDVQGTVQSCIRKLRNGRKITVDMETGHPRGEPWTLGQILRDLRTPDTRLVVLSACESGVISTEKLPNEYLGLPAGFLAAGAHSVVSSLWRVDDRSTCELMKAFYRNLIEKKLPPAKALREAQLWLRKQPQYASPYYWGAFQVSGL